MVSKATLAGGIAVTILSILWTAFAAVDDGHFAVTLPYASDGLPPFVDYSSPTFGPASLIIGSGEHGPPYASFDGDSQLQTPTSCNALYASSCAVKLAVEIVAKVKAVACPSLQSGVSTYSSSASLSQITSELSTSTSNFGIFMLNDDFTITVDTLRADLVGEPIDGLAASGRSVQPRLRERIEWTVGSAVGSTGKGGFVPHYSTRLRSGASVDENDGYATASEVSTYFERCSVSGKDRFFGVSILRRALPGRDGCSGKTNSDCNLQNIQSSVGLALLDFLSAKSEAGYQDVLYNLAYSTTYTVGSTTPNLAQIGPIGDVSSSGLNPTYCSVLANSTNRSWVGLNDTTLTNEVATLAFGGGGLSKVISTWQELNDYQIYGYDWMKGDPFFDWPTPVNYAYEVKYAVGVVFANTAHVLTSGFTHSPMAPAIDYHCAECEPLLTPCAIQTVQYLSSHGLTDVLLAQTATDAFNRITYFMWLGADHDAAKNATIDNVNLTSIWPTGFTLAVYDENGLCVADGSDPGLIGKHFNVLTGEEGIPAGSTTWDRLWAAAVADAGWFAYEDTQAGGMFAKVTKFNRWGSEYVMLSSMLVQQTELGNCTFEIAEPCVSEWMEAEMASWVLTLALLKPSERAAGILTLMKTLPATDGLWAMVYDSNWNSAISVDLLGDLARTASEAEITLYDATISTLGGWVSMPDHTESYPHRALVMSLRYNATDELRIVIGFSGAVADYASCDTGCNPGLAAQMCDEETWRCECPPWYNTYTYTDSSCSSGFGETVMNCYSWEEGPAGCGGENITKLEVCNICTEAGYYCPNNAVKYECPRGFFCEEGSRAPSACPEGTWANDTMSENVSFCIPCEAGWYRDSSMQNGCQMCAAGYSQNETGASKCVKCDRGTYQGEEGSSSCVACESPLVTTGYAFTSIEACVCPEATYTVELEDGSKLCQSCGEGSNCQGFDHEPEAAEGYYLHAATSSGLSIFKCKDEAYCPGGTVGTYSEGRHGISCDQCEDWKTPDNLGNCRDCEALDRAVLPVAIIAFAVALIVLYYGAATTDRSKSNHATLLIVTCASQIATWVQTLTVLRSMAVNWRAPLRPVVESAGFLAFDVGELRVSCHMHVTSIESYLSRLLVPVAALAFVCLVHFICTFVWYFGSVMARFPILFGAMGSIFMAFSISVVLATLSPVQCMHHPNNLWTMREEMSELCWEGSRHEGMVVAAAIGSLLPILFLTAVSYMLRAFPAKMREGDIRFLNTAQFLLSRYRPEVRYCALFLIVRNMALAVVPTIPDPVVQVVTLQTISICGLVVIYRYQPSRVAFANVSEAGLCIGTLLAGSLASFFVADPYLNSITSLVMVVIITMAVMFPIGVCIGLYRFMRQKRQKAFQFFLCHHKAGAGALARLMKMELRRSGSALQGDVFIDSDNLDNLDKLFDFVAQDTQTLVVLCSAELFHRPWCVGEVTTAHKQKLNVVPLYLNDFQPVSDEFVENVHHIVDLRCVYEQGMKLDCIQQALLWIRSLGGLTMPSSVDVHVLRELAKALFDRSAITNPESMFMHGIIGGKLKNKSGSVGRFSTLGVSASVAASTSMSQRESQPKHAADIRRMEVKPPAAVIVDTDNTEALCAARILIDLLGERFGASQGPVLLQNAISDAANGLDLLPSVQRLALICTNGCWASSPFLVDAVHGYWTGLEMLPVVVDTDYKYPTEAFYQELDDFGSRMCRAYEVPENPELLRNLVAYVFKNISSHFHVLASMELLKVQADNISRRLQAPGKASRKSMEQADHFSSRDWSSDFVKKIVLNQLAGQMSSIKSADPAGSQSVTLRGVGSQKRSPRRIGSQNSSPRRAGSADSTPRHGSSADSSPKHVGSADSSPKHVGSANSSPKHGGSADSSPVTGKQSEHGLELEFLNEGGTNIDWV